MPDPVQAFRNGLRNAIWPVLLLEIESGTQRSVAALYAIVFLTVGSTDDPEMMDRCGVANRAIIDRWSRSGLERVKAIAWKIADNHVQRQGGEPADLITGESN